MDDYEFVKALLMALWYDGLDEVLLDWSNLKPDERGVISAPVNYTDAYTARALMWSTIVCYCGEYGTSPRYGWIPEESIDDYYSLMKDITEVWKEEGYQ